MRYSIPKDKETQDQEWKRLLRSLTGETARTADQALKFIMDHANGTAAYDPRSSYQELYRFYTVLGLEPRNNIRTFFKGAELTPENFQKELEKLWRVLQIHSLNKGLSLYEDYEKIKKEPGKYDKMLRDAEALEHLEMEPGGMREEEDVPDRTLNDATLPLVNERSPYYAAVAGTVYEETYNLWENLQKHGDFNQKGEQLLKEDMEQLLSKMQLHYIRHNRFGSYLPMTEKEHKELQDLYGECIRDLTRLSVDKDLKPTCEALNRLLVQNRNQLMGLSPENLPPLAGVLGGMKGSKVEFNNRSQKTVGGVMSSREPVEYTDENGIRHRGFFTADVAERSEQYDAERLFLKYKQNYPAYGKVLSKLFIYYDNFKLTSFYTMLNTAPPKDSGILSLNQFIDKARFISSAVKKDVKFREILENLAVEVGKNFNRHGILEEAGIETGDKVASRACAMSDVARELGFPGLLTESKKITIKRGDKEIKGVMTEAAGLDMADFAYMLYTDPFYTKMDRKQLNSKEMLSSLADLQILDYLCGNTDRHSNNFFLKQDFSDPEHPKLLGVLGIDNDNSFGTITEGGVQNLAQPSDLKIITPKMAAAIEKMTADDLFNLLKPYEFRTEQVNAAKARLADLQDMIRLGRENPGLQIDKDGKLQNIDQGIHIVQDDEWAQLDLQKLIPKVEYAKDENGTILRDEKGKPIPLGVPINIFARANDDYLEHKQAERDRMIAKFRKVPYSLGPNKGKAPIRYSEQKPEEPGERQSSEMDFKALDTFHQREADSLKEIHQMLYNNGGDRLNKRSEEFKKMNTALENYIASYEELHKILTGSTKTPKEWERIRNEYTPEQQERITWRENALKGKKLEAFYRKMETAKQDLDQKIDAYNARKRRRISPRNQMRINAATQLKEYLAQEKVSKTVYNIYRAVKRRDDTPQNTALQITNMENQIYGKMHFTLQDNLSRHSADDPVMALGMRALEAQQRLWNYSMNGANIGDTSVKRPEKTPDMPDEQFQRELFSLEKLQKAVKQDKDKKPDIRQIQKDLNTLYRYTLQLKKSKELPEAAADAFLNNIKQVQDPGNAIGEQEISSREVRGILHNLYMNELTIAKKYEEKVDEKSKNVKKTGNKKNPEISGKAENPKNQEKGPVKNK